MKTKIFAMMIIALSSFSGEQALAEIGADGCYQMYKPGSFYPVTCISGSAEEGINGARIRVALVGPNTTIVRWCALTSTSKISNPNPGQNTLKLLFARETGMRSIELDGKIQSNTDEEGTISLTQVGNKITLKYFKLKSNESERLSQEAFSSEKCKAAGI